MSEPERIRGFKNEVVRVKRQVPQVMTGYPERRFWKFVNAPFFSKSYLKFYAAFFIFFGGSYAVGIWAIGRFNLFQHKIYRGTVQFETDLMGKYPNLDEKMVLKSVTFTDKFKQREKERLEQMRQARQKQKEAEKTREAKQSNSDDKVENKSKVNENSKEIK